MVVIIGSDGFIGSRVKKWAESLNIKHLGVYFDDKEKGEMSFKEYLKSDALMQTKSLIITAGNSDHNLPRVDFFTALKKDTEYLIEMDKTSVNADIVFLSSAAVYYGHVGVVTEDTIVEPTDFYGLSKIYAEYLVRMISKKRKRKLIIFRLTNAYGKNEKRKRLFDNIIDSIKTGKPLVVNGKGESYINPLNVERVAQILLKTAIDINRVASQDGVEIYNLCSREAVRVIDIVNIIKESHGLDVVFSSEKEPYEVNFVVSSEKLVKLLEELEISIPSVKSEVLSFIEQNLS